MKVLIIEDEIPAARQLIKLLNAARPTWQIVGTLDSVQGAIRWLGEAPPPDLIFMDIQLADGISFDIFKSVEVKSPVIFSTAYDQYAIQAFRVNALDYLLKPVDPELLDIALEKIEKRQISPASAQMEALMKYLGKSAFKDRFLVKTGQTLTQLSVSDIAFFHSSDGLTQAWIFSGKKYFIEHPLDELEAMLDPNEYFRVSRKLLVRSNAIKKIHLHLNSRLKLELQPEMPEECFVSRERVADFKAWLGG